MFNIFSLLSLKPETSVVIFWDFFQQNYPFGEIVLFLPIQFEPDVKACCFVEAGDLWWSLFQL
jgi:hypothetical protein